MIVKPDTYLTAAERRELGQRSNLMGAALIAHCWALILGAMALFAWWPNPVTFVLGLVIIGTRQLGLGILMHDAAHGLLFTSRWANEKAGQALCAWPMATDLYSYRTYHMQHHRRTQQDDDPDLVLSAPFPISAKSFWRKTWRDLSGQTAYQRRALQLRSALGPADRPLSARLASLWRELGGAIGFNTAFFALLAAVGYWWLYPLMWLLPAATTHQWVTRVRNIAEHAVVGEPDDVLKNTRTTYANPIEGLLIAPYWVNYHLEHHLFLFVPCWKLGRAHRLMLAKGHGAAMEIAPGYWTVLKKATANENDVRSASVQARTGAARI